MTLPASLQQALMHRFKIRDTEPMGGGCINDCYRLQTDDGVFFLKTNNAQAYPGMFEAEVNGLHLLAETSSIRVPKVIESGTTDGVSFLLLEFIQYGSVRNKSMHRFGGGLAQLHRNSNEHFGLSIDNYIGSLVQKNDWHKTWAEFFASMRLMPQVKMALQNGQLNRSDAAKFDTLCQRLTERIPQEPPALLHGDLWSGNYLIDENGDAVLIDPAVYYGHREMDLAMSRLFGGFNNEFYEGYQESYPLEKDWQQRMDLCNLYPLLVHVNLFGGGYAEQVRRALKKYI